MTPCTDRKCVVHDLHRDVENRALLVYRASRITASDLVVSPAVLNVPEAESEAVVQPDGVTDDLSRDAVP